MYGSLSHNAVSLVEEMFDFTRCERPNGTAYGTAGKCRKGTEKQKDYPYAAAVTQGRFNIPHSGHAKLIKHLLEKAPVAYVILGTGKENVNKDFRAQMLRAVLRKEGVDPSRVQILRGTKAASILKDLAEKEGKDNVLFTLGADQQKFLDSIGKSLGVKTDVVPRSAEGASSSAIRRMIDSGDTAKLSKEYSNDPYLVRLAQVSRRIEKNEFMEHFANPGW